MEERYPGLIKADITWFDRNYKEHQGYELKDVFGVDLKVATYNEIARIHEYYPKYYPWAGLRYIARKISKYQNKKNKPSGEHIYDFGPTQYVKNDVFDKLDISKDWYLEGVYCSDAYLSLLDEKPSKLFNFPEPKNEVKDLLIEMSKCNSVAIHVRRGDYVGTVFDILGTEYYKKAVDYIRNNVDNPVFYVFSDDMKYIEDSFDFIDGYRPVHNVGKKSYVDMQLISGCKHMIIGNSTFSYWGAVIGEKTDSIVIAPKKYKADKDVALARKNWVLL